MSLYGSEMYYYIHIFGGVLWEMEWRGAFREEEDDDATLTKGKD